MTDIDWRDQAACRRADPTWFDPLDKSEVNKHGPHPSGHTRIQLAFTVCQSCPVRAACDQWADDTRAVGVLGGRYRKQEAPTRSTASQRHSQSLLAGGKRAAA